MFDIAVVGLGATGVSLIKQLQVKLLFAISRHFGLHTPIYA
ncbi:hypothetical protein NMEN255_0209 [Neisseria meningitidis NM255]|nr:hypothetical protein NMEN255_0209 [Neisseria meningitidis NM255]